MAQEKEGGSGEIGGPHTIETWIEGVDAEGRRREPQALDPYFLRLRHDPGLVQEPVRLVHPLGHGVPVQLREVFDHRGEEGVPPRSGRSRLPAERLPLLRGGQPVKTTAGARG